MDMNYRGECGREGWAGRRGVKGEKWDNCNSIINKYIKKKKNLGPWLVWLSGLSLDWEPKGLRFGSRLGHMPGLRARSPGWGEPEATTLLSLSFPPLSLKINFKNLKKKKPWVKTNKTLNIHNDR